jgi:CubicO group peptidase (beta-lactamase class C family)
VLAALFCAIPLVCFADSVDDYIQAQMQARHVPGAALAVIRNGQLLKIQTYGLANIEWNQAVTRQSPFWLDSLTKLITAVGVMQLVHTGQIALDDSITRYLPDAPAEWEPVTVRHLLAHQSGIKDDYWEQYKGTALVHYDAQDIYRYAIKQPLQFPPGDRSVYDNEGYYLLGVIIERVTHTPYT